MPRGQPYDFWESVLQPKLQELQKQLTPKPYPSFADLQALAAKKGPLTEDDVAAYAVDMASPSFGLAGTIAGIGAKTANKTFKKAAEIMERKGTPRGEIYDKTGWYKGIDGKWRFEVDDSKASFSPRFEGQFGPMSQFMQHSDLYAAYPELANMPVVVKPLPKGQRAGYNPNLNSISIAPNIAPDSSLLHELQHAIQQRESFVGGMSSKQAKELTNDYYPKGTDYRKVYKQSAGEVEARNTQKRMSYPPSARRVFRPWTTYDVPETHQIMFGNK